jgi:NAD(P)-dependent dehydrogenase (short-subunit alcohol dehydrogenase family)
MEKKTYVISGTSRGIGLELARQALKSGNIVWALARNPEKSEKLEKLKTEFPETLKTASVDVTSDSSVTAFSQKLGNTPVDILINNAGAYLDEPGIGFEKLDFDKVVESFQINTVGAIRMTQSLLPLLQKSKKPKLIHITSLMGSIEDNESGGAYAYRISKAALNMFSKSFSKDFPEISSAVVHPGWVKTDMGGNGAPTSPEESAKGIHQVISDLSLDKSGSFFDFEGDQLPW